MHFTILVAVLTAAITGLAVKFIFDRFVKTQKEITWKEYGIVMAVIASLAAPGSVYMGWETAKKNLVTFNEFWSGWETEVHKEDVECYRDGPCRWEYDCDPYTVSYDCDCNDKGECDTCKRTEYHDCPYATEETHYYVRTTIGTYEIDRHRLPENPQAHRWRRFERIPDRVISNAGTGEHPFWTKAKERIAAGEPGPVTKKWEYNNYIYASEQKILQSFSADIEVYEKSGLFPVFQSHIYDFYHANKVYFVGLNPPNRKDWFDAMSYLNASFGKVLQGDMHLVIIRNDSIASDPEKYALALKAYWQDIKRHGENALSKNSVVAVTLTDGEKIIWTRSFTGMPVGNETMLTALDNGLRGTELSPEKIIGKVKRKLKGGKAEDIYGEGKVENIVFGLKDPETRFKRISMSAKDPDDNGRGFLYLVDQIQPTKKQRIFIHVATFFFCGLGWVIAIVIGDKGNTGFHFRKKR
ncbi:MAG: hypothetical protein V1867_02890 [Candidatus Falkowbacteria bacterium]